MKPIAVRSSAVVQAPAGFVWDFLHVYANDLEWRSGLEKMAQTPPGPVRDGARVEETLRDAIVIGLGLVTAGRGAGATRTVG